MFVAPLFQIKLHLLSIVYAIGPFYEKNYPTGRQYNWKVFCSYVRTLMLSKTKSHMLQMCKYWVCAPCNLGSLSVTAILGPHSGHQVLGSVLISFLHLDNKGGFPFWGGCCRYGSSKSAKFNMMTSSNGNIFRVTSPAHNVSASGRNCVFMGVFIFTHLLHYRWLISPIDAAIWWVSMFYNCFSWETFPRHHSKHVKAKKTEIWKVRKISDCEEPGSFWDSILHSPVAMCCKNSMM